MCSPTRDGEFPFVHYLLTSHEGTFLVILKRMIQNYLQNLSGQSCDQQIQTFRHTVVCHPSLNRLMCQAPRTLYLVQCAKMAVKFAIISITNP